MIGFGYMPPQLRAGGSIAPFRYVASDMATDNTGIQAVAAAGADTNVVGISQGSNRDFTETNHALSGDPIYLQPVGSDMRVEAGAAIDAGDRLMTNATGQAIVATATNFTHGRALEDASGAGAIIRCTWEPFELGV